MAIVKASSASSLNKALDLPRTSMLLIRLMARSLSLVLLCSAGCVPNRARTTAKLKPGTSLKLSTGVHIAKKGEPAEDNYSGHKRFRLHGEVDLEHVFDKSKNNTGLAIQIKVPTAFVLSSLDVFVELPHRAPRWSYGVGADLGFLVQTVYGVVTRSFESGTFVSLTPRIAALYAFDGNSAFRRGFFLMPQLSFGHEKSNTALFVSYGQLTQRATFHCDDCGQSGRRFGLVGAMMEF